MKKLNRIMYLAILSGALLFSGCEIAGLEFQEDAPYDYHVLDNQTGLTALEFLNLQRPDTVFKLMQQGVAYAGLESEYTQPNRTFLFLTNNAILRFNKNGTVNNGCWFGYHLTADGVPGTKWEDYTVEEVRDFFHYHIIEGLYSFEVNLGPENVEVTTLLNAADNKAYMKINNVRNSPLRINDFPFTKRAVNARSSNIGVTNGFVHALDGFVEPGTL